MKLFKHANSNNLFQIHEITEEELIAEYNVCLNFKGYLEEILKKPDPVLIKLAPGSDANQVRNLLNLQLKFCNDYVLMFQDTKDKGKKQN
jgi:hypothetical protein